MENAASNSLGNQSEETVPNPRIIPVVEDKKSDEKEPVDIPSALGFSDIKDFYKMLILAFLAGFAERLVPDILGRLSKRPST